jgi:hypothetical protein
VGDGDKTTIKGLGDGLGETHVLVGETRRFLDYQTHTSAHSGDVANGLIENPEGTHKIDATTVSGAVHLAAR